MIILLDNLTAASEDGRTEIRGWRDNDGHIEEVTSHTEAEGFGVYEKDDEGLMMHVQDFLTFEGSYLYARAINNIRRDV